MASVIFTKPNGDDLLLVSDFVLKAQRELSGVTTVGMIDGNTHQINETPADMAVAFGSSHIVLTSALTASLGQPLLVRGASIQRAERSSATSTRVAVGPSIYVSVAESPADILVLL